MKTLYWNNETDEVVTMEDLMQSFPLFGNEYESFDDYVSACQWYNNGALCHLYKHIQNLEHDLIRFSEWYDDEEKESIRHEVSRLNQMYFEV